jgi:hypothetical protein
MLTQVVQSGLSSYLKLLVAFIIKQSEVLAVAGTVAEFEVWISSL